MTEDGEIINLNPKERESVANFTGQVHQLPCCVKYDGHCSVSYYFKPKSTGMEVEGLKVGEAHFRGRKLQGAIIPLPHGYSAHNPITTEDFASATLALGKLV